MSHSRPLHPTNGSVQSTPPTTGLLPSRPFSPPPAPVAEPARPTTETPEPEPSVLPDPVWSRISIFAPGAPLPPPPTLGGNSLVHRSMQQALQMQSEEFANSNSPDLESTLNQNNQSGKSLEVRLQTQQPTLQAQWLLYEGNNLAFYFWDNRSGEEPPRERWPIEWKSYNKRSSAEALDYFGGSWDNIVLIDSTSSERASRHKKSVYTRGEYALTHAAKQKQGRDNYNPFGRFDTSATMTTFIVDPAANLTSDQKEELLKSYKARAKGTYKTVQKFSDERDSASGCPIAVEVEGGAVLKLWRAVTNLGAIYSDSTVPSSASAQKVGKTSVPPQKFQQKAGKAPAAKEVFAIDIDQLRLQSWQGKKRTPDQINVMGGMSPNEVAQEAGYPVDDDHKWEWLHLVAHSMGGPTQPFSGPQNAGNLVLGTEEANSQMIVAEEMMKDLISKGGAGCKANLWVRAEIVDCDWHIAQQIRYDFTVQPTNSPSQVYVWVFNALDQSQPLQQMNVFARKQGEQFHQPQSTQYTPNPLFRLHNQSSSGNNNNNNNNSNYEAPASTYLPDNEGEFISFTDAKKLWQQDPDYKDTGEDENTYLGVEGMDTDEDKNSDKKQ